METLKIHGSENPKWMMLNGLAILGRFFFAIGAILQELNIFQSISAS